MPRSGYANTSAAKEATVAGTTRKRKADEAVVNEAVAGDSDTSTEIVRRSSRIADKKSRKGIEAVTQVRRAKILQLQSADLSRFRIVL